MTLFGSFATQEELNAQYLPLAREGNAAAIAKWQEASADVRAALDGAYDVPFGPTRDEYLDIFPSAQPGAPVHLFIHGGYWHRFSAKDFSFVATPLVAQGITVVLINYSLCPLVTIDEVVRQCRAAVAWIARNIAAHGADGTRLTVSGHSAGGHLAAMVGETDWPGRYALPAGTLGAVIGISGLYDLRPFPFTALQPSLQLTAEQVYRNSPVFSQGPAMPPTQLFVGERESAEFERQSREFGETLRRRGIAADWCIVPDADHFTILDGFGHPRSALFETIMAACRA